MSHLRSGHRLPLTFPEGLVGYPEWQHFELDLPLDGSPVAWMQGVDKQRACFLVTDPILVCPTYSIEVPGQVRAALGLRLDQAPRVLCILVVQMEPLTITANLLGPIVYNPDNGLARQLVLADSGFSPRHPVVVPEETLTGKAGGGAGC